MNFWDEDRETLLGFAKEKKLEQRILLNGSDVGKDLYGISGVPTSLWIDRSGKIVDTNSDAHGEAILDQKTRKLLASG